MRMCRRLGEAFRGEHEVPITLLEWWGLNNYTGEQTHHPNAANSGRWYSQVHHFNNTRIEFEIHRTAKKIHLDAAWDGDSPTKPPAIWVNLYDAEILPPGATMYDQWRGRLKNTYLDIDPVRVDDQVISRADLVPTDGGSFPPGKYAICICANEWHGTAYRMTNSNPKDGDFVVTVTY